MRGSVHLWRTNIPNRHFTCVNNDINLAKWYQLALNLSGVEVVSFPGNGVQLLDLTGIIRSNSGLVALRSIIAIRRVDSVKFTLSFLSKRLGIKSRSYLTEILKGTKPLNPKHINPLVSLLGLSLPESELLETKLLLEFGDLAPTELEKLKQKLKDTEKKLTSATVEITEVRDIHLVMILAACFHLFKDGSATRRQILELFQRDKFFEIEKALGELLQNGLLISEGEVYRFSPELGERIHLYMATSPKNEIHYLKSSLAEASDKVNGFNKANKDSIFYSGIITADLARYIESLDYVKQTLRSIQSRIESNPADALIRFSVQLYPLVTKQKG